MPQLSNRLQIRDFRLVRAIAETGQLALAAEQLGITQPAASRMLAAIERTIGTSVFQRHPKGMTVTPMGEILARNAITLLNGMEQTAREVEAVGGGRSGTIRVGSVTGGAVAHVVPAIQRLKRDATRADIHIDVAPSDVLIDGLLGGDFDFVLSRIPAGVCAGDSLIERPASLPPQTVPPPPWPRPAPDESSVPSPQSCRYPAPRSPATVPRSVLHRR